MSLDNIDRVPGIFTKKVANRELYRLPAEARGPEKCTLCGDFMKTGEEFYRPPNTGTHGVVYHFHHSPESPNSR